MNVFASNSMLMLTTRKEKNILITELEKKIRVSYCSKNRITVTDYLDYREDQNTVVLVLFYFLYV